MQYTEIDKLDIMINVALSQSEPLFHEEWERLDISDVEFSRRYYRRRARTIRRCKYHNTVSRINSVVSKVAVFAIAVMLAATVAIAAIKPLREAVLRSVVEWYDNYMTIRYEVPKDSGGDINTDGTSTEEEQSTPESTGGESDISQSVTVNIPTSIEEVRKPTYIPDGVIEDVVVQNKVQVIIDYYLGNELVCSFEQVLLKDKNLYADNENSVVDDIMINGFEAKSILSSTDKERIIIWNDGEYIYLIKSMIYGVDYLKNIAESVGK